ncbi:hypothetical protein LPJ81_005253, partial [Coemansia sp. IMI 209127]
MTDTDPMTQQFLPPYITQSQMPNPYDLNTLIPMDLALGLPSFNSQLGVDSSGVPSSNSMLVSSALAALSPMTEMAALQARDSPGPFLLGLEPDFLQQLNPLRQSQVGRAAIGTTSTYSNSTVHSPLNITSPNQLVSSVTDASHVANHPTLAFASLNLANALDMQASPQSANVMRQESEAGNRMTAILANSALSRAPNGITNGLSSSASVLGGMMQSVPNALSSAMTMDSTTLALQQLSALGGTGQAMIPRHNSVPAAQRRLASLDASLSADGRRVTLETSQAMFSSPIVSELGGASQAHFDSNLNVQIPQSERVHNINFANSLLSSSSLSSPESNIKDNLSPESQDELHQIHATYGKQASLGQRIINSISGREPSATMSPLNAASMILADGSRSGVTGNPHRSKESTTGSPAIGTPSSTSAKIGQMNKATIPQMLKDVVEEHPELGCPELIYNLLITHVVHDCSRIGIYQAHLFWMRVGEYKLPKFHLLASIADASRSWSLPDELRAALPPNLDEICYALAINIAPTDDSDLQIISALGLLILASYEFKSARFAPMVEHNCLAYKIIVQVKFRGAPFPWRAAKKTPDESG